MNNNFSLQELPPLQDLASKDKFLNRSIGSVTKAVRATQWWKVLRQVARETAVLGVDFEIIPADLGDDAPLWDAVALAELEIAK